MITPSALDWKLEEIHNFVEQKVIPLEPDFLSRPFRSMLPTLMDLRQDVRKAGLWGLALPSSIGGQDLSLAQFGRVSEALGRTPIGHFIFNCQAPDLGNMELLLHAGSAEQKEQYLQPLADGRIRSCFSMTEPEHPGSNPTWMSTTARREGDEYVIDGHKWYSTAADGATFAIVMAVTNPDAPGRHDRASQIIVPTDAPGYELVRNLAVMGEAGEDWHSHSEIRYHGVRVPISNRIGDEGAGFALAQARLGPGRIHHCMRWIGICERSFDLMCDRAANRQLTASGVLGDQGVIQAWIAESRAEINAARLMVLATAERIDEEGSYAARDDISLIKFYVAGVLERVVDRALQIHGGLGMCDDLPLAYWFRHERAARIYDGPDEVHKMAVARRILKEYQNRDG